MTCDRCGAPAIEIAYTRHLCADCADVARKSPFRIDHPAMLSSRAYMVGLAKILCDEATRNGGSLSLVTLHRLDGECCRVEPFAKTAARLSRLIFEAAEAEHPVAIVFEEPP